MRLAVLSLVVLAAACSREPAPRHAATSALPPSPDSGIAQSVPAGGMPAPVSSVAAVQVGPATAGPAAALSAPRSDPRWRDADVGEVAGEAAKDPALAKFQEEQGRRDAELMARDAEEAQRQLGRGAADESERIAGEDRDWRDSERYRRYAERRARYRGEREAGYRDPRDDGYAGDDRYSGQGEYPPEEMDQYAQPEPWDEIPEGPQPDEDYDPRYEDPYYQR
jgi:hypothetical protein